MKQILLVVFSPMQWKHLSVLLLHDLFSLCLMTACSVQRMRNLWKMIYAWAICSLTGNHIWAFMTWTMLKRLRNCSVFLTRYGISEVFLVPLPFHLTQLAYCFAMIDELLPIISWQLFGLFTRFWADCFVNIFLFFFMEVAWLMHEIDVDAIQRACGGVVN